MPKSKVELLEIGCGSIVAPAGCGKTHLIAESLKKHEERKPILILTHTNAGVVALRQRLMKANVSSSKFRVSTIDGWAIKIASIFPSRSAIDQNVLKLNNPKVDYSAIQLATSTLIQEGHISDSLQASYSQIIVDEYQDCSRPQHRIMTALSGILKVCILGDPMQAIFGFRLDQLPDWGKEVCQHFPVVAQLSTPWRWNNTGSHKLGDWLLEVRDNLANGRGINLKTAPTGVSWIELKGDPTDFERTLQAARLRTSNSSDSILIIGDSKNQESRHRIASAVSDAVTVEAADFRDLILFAEQLQINSDEAIERIVSFAQSTMSNVGSLHLIQRLKTLTEGRARVAASPVEQSAINFKNMPSFKTLLEFLEVLSSTNKVRIYRPTLVKALIRSLQLCDNDGNLAFVDAVMKMREQNRVLGRPLPKRAVGSTLLLKGLEAEMAVVLNADQLDARNLYVAMTRGSKHLVICSRQSTLQPK